MKSINSYSSKTKYISLVVKISKGTAYCIFAYLYGFAVVAIGNTQPDATVIVQSILRTFLNGAMALPIIFLAKPISDLLIIKFNNRIEDIETIQIRRARSILGKVK